MAQQFKSHLLSDEERPENVHVSKQGSSDQVNKGLEPQIEPQTTDNERALANRGLAAIRQHAEEVGERDYEGEKRTMRGAQTKIQRKRCIHIVRVCRETRQR